MLLKLLRVCLLLPLLGVACKKKEEQKSSRRLREEALEANTRDHVAVKKFADAVREVFQWRQSQPVIQSEAERQVLAKELALRLNNMPTENLPDHLVKAWRAMRESLRAAAKSPTLSEAQRQQGAQAAAELNRQLAARGVLDLHF
jgi:hypothetical protein